MPASIDYQRLLQGRYEADRLPGDFSPDRVVPDYAFNVLNHLGLLYRPVADEHFLSNGGTKPAWPGGRPFAVCLTHDVDHVSLHSFQQSARLRVRQCLDGVSFKAKTRGVLGWGMDMVRMAAHVHARDPLHCYERWLALEEKIGARSTFFFWPGWSSVRRHHVSDCAYELTDRIAFDGQLCSVAEMIREMDRRGWEIGLHPSWYSFNDADEMKGQKGALEKALGKEVVSVRQHFLHYDIRTTPRVQAEAGLRYDSTLGFNDNVGFRFGSSYPWNLYDLHGEVELPVIEIPLIIQDGALLNPAKGMRLDEDTAFQYVVQMARAVEDVGGILTLLWHPDHLNDPGWWNLYLRSLEYVKERNAFLGSVRGVAESIRSGSAG